MLINTLKAQRQLISFGFSESQAEGIVEIVSKADEQVATKNDLEVLRQEMTATIYRAILIGAGLNLGAISLAVAILLGFG